MSETASSTFLLVHLAIVLAIIWVIGFSNESNGIEQEKILKEKQEIEALSTEEIEAVSGGSDIPPPIWLWPKWLRPPWEGYDQPDHV